MSDRFKMFTPERTALLVLGAALIVWALVLTCRRSPGADLSYIPMLSDTIVVERIVTEKVDTAVKHSRTRKQAQPTSQHTEPVDDPLDNVVTTH